MCLTNIHTLMYGFSGLLLFMDMWNVYIQNMHTHRMINRPVAFDYVHILRCPKILSLKVECCYNILRYGENDPRPVAKEVMSYRCSGSIASFVWPLVELHIVRRKFG